MKESKVTFAQFSGRTFNSQFGQMFVHNVTFENGDSGEYNSKSMDQDKFIVGQVATYEIIPNSNPQYAAKIKPVNPEYANNAPTGGHSGTQSGAGRKESQDTQKSIERQTALKLAIEYHAKEPELIQAAKLVLTAEYFYQWLRDEFKAKEAPPAQTVATPTPGQPSPVQQQPVIQGTADDLPWQ